MVVVLDTVTSILAGFPVFMTMGFIAKQLNTTVTHVIHSGAPPLGRRAPSVTRNLSF